MRLDNRIRSNSGQLLPTFAQTITVFNKLDAEDAPAGQDVWYTTVIPNCAYSTQSLLDAAGNTFNSTTQYAVRIPQQQSYLSYAEWAKAPQSGFTLRLGDVVVKGEAAPEDSTNASDILQKHRPDAFLIGAFSNNTAAARLARHYRIGGES